MILRPVLSLPLICTRSTKVLRLQRFYTTRNLLAESLSRRGLISSFFPVDEKQKFVDLCNAKPVTVYAGFDPTADALHVGNLAVVMMLLHALRGGHHVIALVGGATGIIGDPSGKNKERPALCPSTIDENVAKLKENISRVFSNHEANFWQENVGEREEKLTKVMILNNYDWYKSISCLEFVGKIGRHFRLGMMLMKDSVKARMESEEGLSFTEFTYQIFQAYDWHYLCKHYDCVLQIGGHDQMGNIYAGHDFISRTFKRPVYGITVPLITTETGEKFGKTAGNAVWLDPNKTSPFQFYQFFLRTQDSDVERMLKLFTFKGEQEIQGIMKKHLRNPELRSAQKELASEVTTLVHGKEGLDLAILATEVLYSESVEALCSLKSEDLERLFRSSGSTVFSDLILQPGTTVLDMAMKAGCFQTEKDAVRIMKAGGFSLNYRKVNNFEEVISPGVHILPNQISLARVGKKHYYVIKWSS